MSNRKQEVDKALRDEQRRINEQGQGVVKTEATNTVSFSTGQSTSSSIGDLINASDKRKMEKLVKGLRLS